MIEKMKKLSLIIYHNSKDKFLNSLQNLGVVHLEVDKTIQNEEIVELNDELTKLRKAERLLKNFAKSHKTKEDQIEYNDDINNLLTEIDDENDKLNHLRGDMDNINKEINMLIPWGIFDSIYFDKLNKIGLNFRFFVTPKSKFEKIDKENLAYEIINVVKGKVYFTVAYRDDEDISDIDANEIRLPIKSIKQSYKDSVRLQNDIIYQQKKLKELTRYIDCLDKLILEITDKLEYKISDANLAPEAEGKIYIITGWIPKKKFMDVEAFLKKEDVVYLIDDPTEEDNVPILLKNGPFAKLFEPITKMHSMPQYNEVDPTPFFAPFFALFFGLCLADIGYGFILLLGIIGAFIFIKNKKILPILMLGLILSFTTMFSGVILDSFFGQSNFSKLIELNILPQSFKSLIVLSQLEHQMAFAVMLGVLQVMLGFILQSTNRFRLYGFVGCLQPIGTLFLLVSGVIAIVAAMAPKLMIGPMPVGNIIMRIPNVMTVSVILMCIGLFLVLLFNSVNKKIYIRPAIGLWELYGIVTGVPGDILSYLRLFALGLAGGLLGSAFNQIGFMLRGDTPTIYGVFFMILIMIIGHSINIGLAALSAFVHPLRLVLLEFYKAVGYTGGGLAYSPFKNRLNLKNK